MTVGQHDGVNSVPSLDQPAKVRQDQIDAVHSGLRKHESGVDNNDAAVLF
jgi:hypothetical protein